MKPVLEDNSCPGASRDTISGRRGIFSSQVTATSAFTCSELFDDLARSHVLFIAMICLLPSSGRGYSYFEVCFLFYSKCFQTLNHMNYIK